MKALTRQINEPRFEPIELKLNIVSQKEFDMIHCLFNHSPVCEAMRRFAQISPHNVRTALERVGSVDEENAQEIMELIAMQPPGRKE